MGCSLWGREESDTTERLHFPFSLSCIGEGNGNPLQCSCLENPRDGGAWWAAVYAVALSQTRLKRLSSSNSMNLLPVPRHVSESVLCVCACMSVCVLGGPFIDRCLQGASKAGGVLKRKGLLLDSLLLS